MELQIAVQTDNLGLVQDELGRPDRALAWHEKALDLIRPLNHPRWEAVVKSNLADTHLALAQAEAAGALFDEALQTGRASEDIELTVRGLIGKARAALKQGQPDAAGELLGEAIPLARRADLRRLLAHALMAQSEQQALLGQAARAADLWNEARRLFTLLQASQANPETRLAARRHRRMSWSAGQLVGQS
jgi:tetratricopeptide (TPR) repeat protein